MTDKTFKQRVEDIMADKIWDTILAYLGKHERKDIMAASSQIIKEFESLLDGMKENRPTMLSIGDNEHYLMSESQWNGIMDYIKKEIKGE